MSALYQTNTLNWIFTVLAQCSNSSRKEMPHHSTYYPDSVPTNLCSYSLKLHAQRRTRKYQYYSIWFDPNPRSTAFEVSTLTIIPPNLLYLGYHFYDFSIGFQKCSDCVGFFVSHFNYFIIHNLCCYGCWFYFSENFGFPIFLAYLMKVILETRHAH